MSGPMIILAIFDGTSTATEEEGTCLASKYIESKNYPIKHWLLLSQHLVLWWGLQQGYKANS